MDDLVDKVVTGDVERRVWLVEGLEVRAAHEEGPRRIVGYAAVYGRRSNPIFGMFVEVIEPGAFAGVLDDDVRALWNHDPNYVLGRTEAGTLMLEEDELGLRVAITPPDAQWARDLLVSIERGDVTQMSFAWRSDEDWWDEAQGDGLPVRHVTRIERLYDVSPVTFPAYEQTTVAVRSMAEKTLRARRDDNQSDSGAAGAVDVMRRKLSLLDLEVV